MTYESDPRRPAGSCRHRPISNGWSQHYNLTSAGAIDAAVVHCGYCKAFIEVDDQWIDKFVTAGRAAPVRT